MIVRTAKKRDMLKTVIRLSDREELDDRKLSFLESVYLPGFFKLEQVSGRKFSYCGKYGISLAERLKKPVTEHQFYILAERIVVATERLIRNNLPINGLLLNPDYVYISAADSELQFIYVPVKESEYGDDIPSFLIEVANRIIPEDFEDAEYIQMFIRYMNQIGVYSPKHVENYIEFNDRVVVKKLRAYDDDNTNQNMKGPAKDVSPEEELSSTVKLRDVTLPTMQMGIHNAMEEAKLQTDETYASLERVQGNEIIPIRKTVFRFGTDADTVDYEIRNNPAVSRNHMDLIVRRPHFYVMDLYSKNKTYVNNHEIPAKTEKEIFNGDRIRMANEEFIFYDGSQESRTRLLNKEE